jgi:hypothetical protein
MNRRSIIVLMVLIAPIAAPSLVLAAGRLQCSQGCETQLDKSMQVCRDYRNSFDRNYRLIKCEHIAILTRNRCEDRCNTLR